MRSNATQGSFVLAFLYFSLVFLQNSYKPTRKLGISAASCCFSPTITNVSFKYISFEGHFGFQKKRTVKYGPLNWPIIALELTEWYDKRTYSELIALLYQLRYITLSLTIQNFFSTRSRNLTCTCGRPAKLLIVYWLLVQVHIRTRQNDGRISLQKNFWMVKDNLI